MTLCYFSRLCGQRFRELDNGKKERARDVGERRERGRRIDRKTGRNGKSGEQGGGLHNTPVNAVFICTNVDAADKKR